MIGSGNVHSNMECVCVRVVYVALLAVAAVAIAFFSFVVVTMHLKMFRSLSCAILCCWKQEECLTISVVSVFLYHSCHVQLQHMHFIAFYTNLCVRVSIDLCVYLPSNEIVNRYASRMHSNRFLDVKLTLFLLYMHRNIYVFSLSTSFSAICNVSFEFIRLICLSCWRFCSHSSFVVVSYIQVS